MPGASRQRLRVDVDIDGLLDGVWDSVSRRSGSNQMQELETWSELVQELVQQRANAYSVSTVVKKICE